MFKQTQLIAALVIGFGSTIAAQAITPDLLSQGQLLARHGADNKPGDVKGEGAGHPNQEEVITTARRGRGADDKPGDVKGEGAGHPNQEEVITIARRGRGADDAPGDVRREDRRQDRRADRRQA